MNHELGKRIAQYRKARGLTQEALAQSLGVSAQAVSKWEVGSACPDILLLPKLAELLGLTVDQLLTGEKTMEVQVLPPEQRKKLKDMVLRIAVERTDGKPPVNVRIPMTLVKLAARTGMSIPKVAGATDVDMDFAAILEMVEQGMVGHLLEVDCGNGTMVRIYVE